MTDQTATTRAAAALLAAEEDRDKAKAALEEARIARDAMKGELERITAEMKTRIATLSADVTTCARDLADAEDFVRRLTPRKPRTRPSVALSDDDVAGINAAFANDDNADA